MVQVAPSPTSAARRSRLILLSQAASQVLGGAESLHLSWMSYHRFDSAPACSVFPKASVAFPASATDWSWSHVAPSGSPCWLPATFYWDHCRSAWCFTWPCQGCWQTSASSGLPGICRCLHPQVWCPPPACLSSMLWNGAASRAVLPPCASKLCRSSWNGFWRRAHSFSYTPTCSLLLNSDSNHACRQLRESFPLTAICFRRGLWARISSYTLYL